MDCCVARLPVCLGAAAAMCDVWLLPCLFQHHGQPTGSQHHGAEGIVGGLVQPGAVTQVMKLNFGPWPLVLGRCS